MNLLSEPSLLRSAVSRKILVIEDSADARESLKDVLELMGHEVETAPDGPRGVEAAVRYQPDVVFTDIGLPVLDGYQVARAIRGHDPERRMFLVALTGYGGREMRDRALDAGFNLHVVKPCDTGVLAKILSEL